MTNRTGRITGGSASRFCMGLTLIAKPPISPTLMKYPMGLITGPWNLCIAPFAIISDVIPIPQSAKKFTMSDPKIWAFNTIDVRHSPAK